MLLSSIPFRRNISKVQTKSPLSIPLCQFSMSPKPPPTHIDGV